MREIRIAGGGLAGLALGILLRQKGIPTAIWEAGTYPRHRVCGEFISGRGTEIYDQITSAFRSGGRSQPRTASARTVRFFLNQKATRTFRLPRSALSVSRFELDKTLAEQFENGGGRLHQKTRWLESFESEGTVRATGRRVNKTSGSRLVGLKVHAKNLQLSADLELHFARGAYVGLSRLPDGQINVCGLFRLNDRSHFASDDYRPFIASHLGKGTCSQFEGCELDESSFSSVAGLSLAPESAVSNECRIGDSICMIAPLTGNGMSLAFESASCASESLARYSEGSIPWDEARRMISQNCDKRFGKRLRYAYFLQQCVFTRPGQWFLLSTLKAFPGLFGGLFSVTRG